jgi:hypothetical protein
MKAIFSDDNSTESENSFSENRIKLPRNSKLNEILSKIDYNRGIWVSSKNVTKKGPEIFLKHLNRCTSYYPKEKNHTFTDVLYIPEVGYSLIHFLSKKMASQFFHQKQGMNWIDLPSDDEDLDISFSDSDDELIDKSQAYEIFPFVEYNENEEKLSNLESDEIKAVKIFKACRCKIIKISNEKKIINLINKYLKKIKGKNKYYYYFLFKDTENAENYFRYVDFNYPL